jgi:twitching motility protein PilT
MANLHDFLKEMVDRGASDLHISAGIPPMIRLRNKLIPLDFPPLSAQDTAKLCYSVLAQAQKQRLEEEQEIDLSFGLRGLSRFRANFFMQRGTLAGAFRVIPQTVPSFDSLGLPKVVEVLCKRPRGLVLVTGPTGSGKSTTLAAMIDRINSSRQAHVVTIEDPIEFLHRHQSCIVNQREVHQDTKSFHAALRSVLRQDPDVVLIGEMRDLETTEAALTVSETGHLTFATLHTNSCAQTISRVVDIFPAHQQARVRTQLSLVLEGVLSQMLLPTKDGVGRVMAMEVMVPNAALRNLIREDKTHQIYSQMQVGQTSSGMMTMNQSLVSLCEEGLITLETALSVSAYPDELRSLFGSASQNK